MYCRHFVPQRNRPHCRSCSGSRNASQAEEDILIVPEGDSLVDNLKKAAWRSSPGNIFLSVPLMCLLTAEAVEDFGRLPSL